MESRTLYILLLLRLFAFLLNSLTKIVVFSFYFVNFVVI